MQNILARFQIEIGNPWVYGIFNSIFFFVLFASLFLFGRTIVINLLTKLVRTFRNPPDEVLVQALYSFLRQLLFFWALYLSISGLPLHHDLQASLTNTIFVIVAVLIVSGLFKLSNIVGQILRYHAQEFEPLITKLLKILSLTVATMIVMRHFNYDIWHIVTALGVGTLAVGLAAQPTLSNMIAGFTILIDRPFRPGDRIALAGGETGDILAIGMRSTRIQTIDGNMLIVSNSELVNSRVVNFSMPNDRLSHKIKFYFDLNTELMQVKPLIHECVAHVPGILKDSVSVLSTNVMEGAVEVGAFFHVEHFGQTVAVTDRVIDAVLLEMKKRNVQFSTIRPEPYQRIRLEKN